MQALIAITDPFFARFGRNLPKGLAEEAAGMQWRTFMATYAPAASVRVQIHSEQRLPGFHNAYHATVSGVEHTIIASGPVSACTHLLADAGRRVEILKFHQCEIFEATVTFIYACHNNTKKWAVGFGGSNAQSVAAALSAAGERLR